MKRTSSRLDAFLFARVLLEKVERELEGYNLTKGSLSNDDVNAMDDGWKKIDLNFNFEFRNNLELFFKPSGLKSYPN